MLDLVSVTQITGLEGITPEHRQAIETAIQSRDASHINNADPASFFSPGQGKRKKKSTTPNRLSTTPGSTSTNLTPPKQFPSNSSQILESSVPPVEHRQAGMRCSNLDDF